MRVTQLVKVASKVIVMFDTSKDVHVGSRFARRADLWKVLEVDHLHTNLGRVPFFLIESLTGGPDLVVGDPVDLVDHYTQPIVYDGKNNNEPLTGDIQVGQMVMLIREDGAELFKVKKDTSGYYVKSFAVRPEVFRLAYSGLNWHVDQPR